MQINIIAMGQNMPGNLAQEYQSYAQRLPINCALKEIPLNDSKKRHAGVIKKESMLMLKAANQADEIIVLDQIGKQLTSLEIANQLTSWQQYSSKVAFLIGGPEGHSNTCRQSAKQIWSLSQMTFPHMLVRVILIEQLYRAYCHNINHPYAK